MGSFDPPNSSSWGPYSTLAIHVRGVNKQDHTHVVDGTMFAASTQKNANQSNRNKLPKLDISRATQSNYFEMP